MARSVTPTIAVAFLLLSAALVAVMVIWPAPAGGTKVAVVAVFGLKVPAVALQITPAAPTSLVTVAVSGRVCHTVSPPRFGVTLTTILVAEVTALATFE